MVRDRISFVDVKGTRGLGILGVLSLQQFIFLWIRKEIVFTPGVMVRLGGFV